MDETQTRQMLVAAWAPANRSWAIELWREPNGDWTLWGRHGKINSRVKRTVERWPTVAAALAAAQEIAFSGTSGVLPGGWSRLSVDECVQLGFAREEIYVEPRPVLFLFRENGLDAPYLASPTPDAFAGFDVVGIDPEEEADLADVIADAPRLARISYDGGKSELIYRAWTETVREYTNQIEITEEQN